MIELLNKERKRCLLSESRKIQLLLNHTVRAIKEIIPMNIEVHPPTVTPEPYVQKEISVLIGLVGETKGRILIDTTESMMKKIGEKMFHIPITNEYLESLSGEIGNMLSGNVCVGLESDGLVFDISTPTIMSGEAKFHGFGKAITLPVSLDGDPSMKVLIMLDD